MCAVLGIKLGDKYQVRDPPVKSLRRMLPRLPVRQAAS